MSEFVANARLLTLSLKSLSMFGTGIKPQCGESEANNSHLLLQHDNRLAEAREFCLVLFKKKSSHSIAKGL